jgi:hypothetical protein
MATALWLLAVQGVIGAFDTLYFHEWRARLPARHQTVAAELKIHAVRDFLYAVIFGTLPWLTWEGRWALVLTAILIAEIVLTMADFVTEARVRKSFGDVYAAERVTHAVMAIIYGAILGVLLPEMWTWWSRPTDLHITPTDIPVVLRCALGAMAVGVFLSGVRDAYAAGGFPNGAWPWAARQPARAERSS